MLPSTMLGMTENREYKQLTKPNNGYTIRVSIDTLEETSWLKKQKLELKVS